MLASVIACAALALATLALPARLAFRGGDKYTFFVGNTSRNCTVITAPAAEAGLKRLCLKQVCGESATYYELDLESFLQSVDGQIIFTETLEDSVNYYCTADLPYSIELYGHEINLHVCVKKDCTVAGSPIIFGGY